MYISEKGLEKFLSGIANIVEELAKNPIIKESKESANTFTIGEMIDFGAYVHNRPKTSITTCFKEWLLKINKNE